MGFFAFTFLLIPPSVNAQTFKETIIEFKKFEAKTNVGINFNGYFEALASIEYATGAFVAAANEENAENKKKFESALLKYKTAGFAWKLHRIGRQDAPELFKNKAPEFCPKTTYFAIGKEDNFQECITEIWTDAAQVVNTAKEVDSNVQKRSTDKSIIRKK